MSNSELNIEYLVKLTPREIKEKAPRIGVRVLSYYYDSNEEDGYFKRVRMKIKDPEGTPGTIKLVTFRFYENHKNIKKDKVWCHCSCEYFTYNLEVALANRGVSTVINSNGLAPIVRNPRQIPHVCKHIMAAIPIIETLDFEKPEDSKMQSEKMLLNEIMKYMPLTISKY